MNKRPGTTSIPEGVRADRDNRDGEDHPEQDRELVSRCQQGDRDAFRILFQRYQRRAFTLAFGVVHDQDGALDVVQDAFLKAYRSIAGFEGTSSFYTWLYRIVMNVAIDHLRRSKRSPVVDYDDSIERDADDQLGGAFPAQPAGSNPYKELLRREAREKLDSALAQLSPNHRAVLILREIDGLSYEEMAEVMGCSKGTIMSRLFHARRNMQKFLTAGYGEEKPTRSEEP